MGITLETYLRCMTTKKPKHWSKWLPLAQWWYNASVHFATEISPYEILFKQLAPTHLPCLQCCSGQVNAKERSNDPSVEVLYFKCSTQNEVVSCKTHE